MKKYITQHTIAAALIGLVVGGGVGYIGERQVSSYSRAARTSLGGAGMMGATGMRSGMRGGGFISGQILSKDATSLTVKGPDGSSKIVLLGPSAQVSKSAAGSVDDLSVGTNVLVTGTINSDQSVTAQTVQIRPALPTPPTNSK